MPFLRLLVSRVEAFVRRLMGGDKRDPPPRRSRSHTRRRTRSHGFPSRPKAAHTPRSVFPRRTDRIIPSARHWHRGAPPALAMSAPNPPATTSHSQKRPSPPGRHPSNTKNSPPKPTGLPSEPKPKGLPPTSKDLPPEPALPPKKSTSRRPKSKCLPPNPKDLPPEPRLPRKSKQHLPPSSKNLPPIPAAPQPPLHDAPAPTYYFPNASGWNVETQNIHNVQTFSASKTVFDYLNPHIAHGAAHNSDERCDAPKCHPRTRVAVQEEIVGWLKRGDGDEMPKKIMWLSGPAGTGKTAIAGSIAETCRVNGILAGSFFFSSFSGSEDRHSKRCVITTIASHLAEHEALHGFKVERNPAIFHRCLREQAECLILGPLRAIQKSRSTASWPTGIVIDGLDEVEARQYHDPTRRDTKREDDDDQLEILNALFALATDPAFPFRIFISSRPERIIQDFFSSTADELALKLFLDSKYNPDADITRFLEAKFAAIRRQYGISGHSSSWPGQAVLDRLVEMSSGQFIVPAVIIRWVEGGVPQDQLDVVLELEREDFGTKNPFATLDAIYSHILKRAHNPEHDPHLVVKWIVCITASTRRKMPGFPSKPPSAQFWRQFLEDKEGELNYRMAPITSLIAVSPSDSSSCPIKVYHKSLTDFLYTQARCGDLYVNMKAYESFCANRIAIVLQNKGPAIPLSSPNADLPNFLREFENLKLVVGSGFAANHLICEYFSRFLACLNKDARGGLALCDVAWWTCLLLKTVRDMQGSSLDGVTLHNTLLGGLYCGIHKAMECDSSALDRMPVPLAQNSTQQAQDAICHAACTHWRRGILDHIVKNP